MTAAHVSVIITWNSLQGILSIQTDTQTLSILLEVYSNENGSQGLQKLAILQKTFHITANCVFRIESQLKHSIMESIYRLFRRQ